MEPSGSASQPERVLEEGRAGHEAGTAPYRLALELVVELHQLRDIEKLTDIAFDLLDRMIGPVEGVFLLRGLGGQDRRFQLGGARVDRGAPDAVGDLLLEKALESGLLVGGMPSDPRAIAVPVGVSGSVRGALYLRPSAEGRLLSAAQQDTLLLFARHLGAAIRNGLHAADLALIEGLSAAHAPVGGMSLRQAKFAFERRLIDARLRDAAGNIAAAARSLDMDRGQLSRLLKKHGIEKGRYRSESEGVDDAIAT
jgi:hypothetical protein